MFRYALLAVAAATAIAVVFVMLPTGVGQRPEPRILSNADTTPSSGFVIHPAAPASPDATPPAPGAVPGAPAAAPPGSGGDLDAVMQRLRAGAAKPDASAPAAAVPAAPGTPPAVAAIPTAPVPPAGTPPAATVPAAPDPAAAAAPKWSSITGQGTRWRMARSDNGYTVAIDLGAGQVANVHVQPAFGNLDPMSINVRVDYLRETILQNFSRQSGSYTFARDGSVSVDR